MFRYFRAREDYKIFGPQGGISSSLVLPAHFNPEVDKCPIVVLMHGFLAKKELYPIPSIAEQLAKAGIASIRFDFDAHGKSEGEFADMTISSEIADAKAVIRYARSLPFVTDIALLGHSQGGVVAGMAAGELENDPARPSCIVLLAPASVLKDDAIAGQCMNVKYNASDPPEYVKVFFHKLGRPFILEAQRLPIYETTAKYTGNVCIVHGDKDTVVPLAYGEHYHEILPSSEFHVLKGDGHMLNSNKPLLFDIIVSYFKKNFSL